MHRQLVISFAVKACIYSELRFFSKLNVRGKAGTSKLVIEDRCVDLYQLPRA